jgi:hypothetical protein
MNELTVIVLFSWIEILFNPRNQVEQAMASMMTFVHPYLAWCTYKFHVEKSREIGKLKGDN